MSSDRRLLVPDDRHYDRVHHLWARREEGTSRVRIGMDSIGLESLGELAYISLHGVGTTIVRGEPMGSLEAAKMTTNIAAPLSGTIVQRNDAVLQDPLLVNRDPYEDGWLAEIEATDWEADAGKLVSGAAIPGWAAAEIARVGSED